MYRQEAIDEIQDWESLLSAAYDNNFDFGDEYGKVCENMSSFNDWVEDQLYDWASECCWSDLKDRLNDLPTSLNHDEVVFIDGYGDWVVWDRSDFEERKNDFIDYMDEWEYWEEELDEEDYETPVFDTREDGVDYLRDKTPVVDEEIKTNVEDKFFMLLEF